MINKYWLFVVVSAIFEIMWVIGLKHANDFASWTATLFAIAASFGGLIYSSKKLPAGTVYAVFVGLGTAGTVISEAIWFNVPFSWLKLVFITLLLIGIVGLKLITHEDKNNELKEGGLS